MSANSKPATGKIDELGRVIIPRNLRIAMDLRVGSTLEFDIKDGALIAVVKEHPEDLVCAYCKSPKVVIKKNGRGLCQKHSDRLPKPLPFSRKK